MQRGYSLYEQKIITAILGQSDADLSVRPIAQTRTFQRAVFVVDEQALRTTKYHFIIQKCT
ncbi:hypothetical protein L210DRAFT_942100 [Boletus edulis BED1]|uniref:Uncharacterized protein n=1 Tax=Boletus edulis BED1 TaxID=1328754 RepID=A0AAD4BGG9_BOLED|nr:hypothetical protein L210DRAFT_942100 [Boletus edulis BED1]